jgi:hypothetical protein
MSSRWWRADSKELPTDPVLGHGCAVQPVRLHRWRALDVVREPG